MANDENTVKADKPQYVGDLKFPAKTLGSMLKVKHSNHDNKADKYELADAMSKITTRTNLPDGLIRYLWQYTKDMSELTNDDLKELSNAKLIDFWLLQQVHNPNQRDTLIDLFDTKTGLLKLLQSKVDNQQASTLANPNQALLESMDKKISKTMDGMERLYSRQRHNYENSQLLDSAIYKTVVWTLARQMGWADPKLPMPGEADDLAITMNSDNYLKLCQLMRDYGAQEIERIKQMKNGGRV